MGNRRRASALVLGFQQVLCGCGEVRIFAQRCKHCGRAPATTEVDTEFHRRRKLVEHARAALERSEVVPPPGSIEELLAIGEDCLPNLIPFARGALQGEGTTGFDAFATAVAGLVCLQRHVDLLTRFRPTRALRPLLTDLCVAMSETASTLLDALIETDISVLRARANAIQPTIDAATATLSRITKLTGRWSIAQGQDTSLEAALIVAFEVAEDETRVTNILDLARFGSAAVEARFPGVVVPTQFGASCSVMSAIATLYFDQDQFSATVAWQVALVQANPETVRQLVETASWKANWLQASRQAVAASDRIRTLLSAAADDHASVHAVLDFSHDLQEGLTKTVLASSRIIWRDNVPLVAVLAGGVSTLAEWAAAQSIPGASSLRLPTRNAKAHNDWRLDGEEVVLCELRPPTTGPIRVPLEELVDHVLAITETSLAMHVGLVVGLSSIGVDIPDGEALFEQAWDRYCAAILRGGGWFSATVSMVDETVRIVGAVDRPASLLELVSLMPYLPKSAVLIECDVTTALGNRHVVLPIQTLRAHGDATDETSKGLIFASVLRQSTIDDVPIITQTQFRKVVVVTMSSWVIEPDKAADVSASFKAARLVAASCDDHELVMALRVAQGWRVSRLSGFKRDIADIQAFTDFMKAQVPEPRFEF